MKKILALLIITALTAVAPTSLVRAQTGGGIGFFLPGVHTLDYSALNQSLPAGYPSLEKNPLVTAGAGYGVFYGVVIGGQGGTLHGGSYTRDNQQVDLEGEFGYFSLGYVVLNKKGFLLFPTASIGDNILRMHVHLKDQEASFGSVTGEPYQATTLVYHRPMLKFALTGTYVLMGSRDFGGSAGLMVGLEVGYQMPYKSGTWTYDNGTINDGPAFDTRGFFISLAIGGGGVAKR